MLTGLDRLVRSRFAEFHALNVGLVTHSAAVDGDLRSCAELFRQQKQLVALFGPEHGLAGFAQDLEHVQQESGPFAGVRLHTLYGTSFDSLKPTQEMLAGLDVLVVDLVDIGSRYYTFQATMLYCMQAAAECGLRVLVLDRPNPINGVTIEGPMVSPGFESFVGVHPIPTRHAMTMGELARVYRHDLRLDVELDVIECEGWKREQWFDQTGLPWVMPSPNMPTLDTATVYPGMCLIEGTNLSEGRGTTRPFELVGAPGVDALTLAKCLNDEQLPGVVFRPTWFKPTFQKHAGKLCGGVQLHVTDRGAFRPVQTGLAVLAAFRNAYSDFAWRTEEYEFVREPIAIDLLFGSNRERQALEVGVPWREIADEWA